MTDINSIDRKNFIEKLASLSPEEINTLIREKGKKPKLMRGWYKVIEEENMKNEN